jgi:HK97 family phage major capsid protein
MTLIVDLAVLRGVEAHATHLEAIRSRLTALVTEADGQPMTDEADAEFAALDAHKREVEAALVKVKGQVAYLEQLAADPARTEPPRTYEVPNLMRSKLPDNLFDLGEYRSRAGSLETEVALMRDGARKVAEQATYPHPGATAKGTVEHVHRLLATLDGGDRESGTPAGSIARRILATGSELYGRAFGKAISGMPLTPQEQAAISTVGTTTTGGYAVPFQLDPTVILTSDGATNPLRTISRVEQIVGNTWKGVTSAGITVTRGPAENQPVDPDNVTLGQPEVTVQPVKAEVQFSIEAGEDWPRLQAEVARMFQDAKDTEEADSFVNGVGTTVYPGGIAATLDPSSYVATIDTSNPIALALGDLFNLRGALPPRFRPGASYLASDSIFGLVRQIGTPTVGDTGIWTYGITDGDPDRLLGKPAYESSAMADDTTAENLLVIYGNFQYFLIAEKIGMTVELDPHVRNGDGKWTGQRALLMHYRNSSVILADNAFRALHAGAISS